MIPTKPAEDGWMLFVNLAEAKHLKGLKPKKTEYDERKILF